MERDEALAKIERLLAEIEELGIERPRVPDRIDEVIGFRAWAIQTGTTLRPPVLLSLNGTRWPHDDWLFAECAHRDHNETVPARACTCGIYAARDRRELARQWAYNTWANVVIGEVGLAGKVIPGTKAHRAEKARVRRLFVPYTRWKLAEALATAYHVQVDLTNVLAEEDLHANWPAV